MRTLLAALACVIVAPAHAAVIVVSNFTAETVPFQVKLGAAAPVEFKIVPGESKPITCGRTVEITYQATDGAKRLALEPYSAYLFAPKKNVGIELIAIGLVGTPGELKDIPEAVPETKPLKVPVKLLTDDSDPRTKPVWSAALKRRFEKAAAILAHDTGVTFELAALDDWTIDPMAADLKAVLVDFEKQMKPAAGTIAVGYVNKSYGAAPMAKGVADVPLSMMAGFYTPAIVIREGEPRAEPERVEVLVQQLSRWLGAVTSPDPHSAMRAKLGDGKAIHARFHVGLDPLNMLATNIIAEEMRKTPARTIAEWPAITQMRLARVYGTLHQAMPEEPLSEEISALLDRANLKAAAAPDARPMRDPAAEAPKVVGNLGADQEAARKVLKAIVVKAEENASKPAADRLKGDDLTQAYIRAAADMAFTLDDSVRKKAFLYAIGIGLDDSDLTRRVPVFGDLSKAIESNDERKTRLAVLGNPTVRHRRDLCQHFAVSAALTAKLGPALAEGAGYAKELKDMMDKKQNRGTGFDFSDLAGDFAGIEFGKYVLANGERLKTLREGFTVADFVPKVDDLANGLSEEKLKEHYGGIADKRFTDAVEAVRNRVKDLSVYKGKREN